MGRKKMSTSEQVSKKKSGKNSRESSTTEIAEGAKKQDQKPKEEMRSIDEWVYED
ncbi:MAG: hypothetical protein ABSH41_01760 [Syntrophobacteraceae bacterium]|jgi:hypothetical protein